MLLDGKNIFVTGGVGFIGEFTAALVGAFEPLITGLRQHL
jgi:hypothetical protein